MILSELSSTILYCSKAVRIFGKFLWNKKIRSWFLIFPVVIKSNCFGFPLSKKDLKKSESLETKILGSSSNIFTISLSWVSFSFSKSRVCIQSCPFSEIHLARASGKFTSTKNLKPPELSLLSRRIYILFVNLDSQLKFHRESFLLRGVLL